MHISPWGQGVMFANCVWFLWFYSHRRDHLCVPRCKVRIDHSLADASHSPSTPEPMEQFPRV